jgi:hypothetical protein
LLLTLGTLTSVFNDKNSLGSHKTVPKFFDIFCLLMEGSGSVVIIPDPKHCLLHCPLFCLGNKYLSSVVFRIRFISCHANGIREKNAKVPYPHLSMTERRKFLSNFRGKLRKLSENSGGEPMKVFSWQFAVANFCVVFLRICPLCCSRVEFDSDSEY